MRSQRDQQKVWDKKRMKYVNRQDVGNRTGVLRKKKIRTESGAVISASYKTSLYDEWKKKARIDDVSTTRRCSSDEESKPKQGLAGFKRRMLS